MAQPIIRRTVTSIRHCYDNLPRVAHGNLQWLPPAADCLPSTFGVSLSCSPLALVVFFWPVLGLRLMFPLEKSATWPEITHPRFSNFAREYFNSSSVRDRCCEPRASVGPGRFAS